MTEIIIVTEYFYTRLSASDLTPGKTAERTSLGNEVPPVTKERLTKALVNRGSFKGGKICTRKGCRTIIKMHKDLPVPWPPKSLT